MVNFISVCTSSNEILKDSLEFIEKQWELFTYEELLNHAKQNLHANPCWLPVLVKGSIRDAEINDEITVLIRHHLHSDNPEIQKYAIIAACIDELYYSMFKDTIAGLADTGLPKQSKDLINKITTATKRPVAGGLFFLIILDIFIYGRILKM